MTQDLQQVISDYGGPMWLAIFVCTIGVCFTIGVVWRDEVSGMGPVLGVSLIVFATYVLRAIVRDAFYVTSQYFSDIVTVLISVSGIAASVLAFHCGRKLRRDS